MTLLKKLKEEALTVCYNKAYEGSGWRMMECVGVILNYSTYIPYRGGCEKCKLPEWVNSKEATISMLNKCNRCFYWCIVRFFNPKTHHQGRITTEDKSISPHKFANFNEINYPVSSDDIEKFQKPNPPIHLLVYLVEEELKITPLIFNGEKHAKTNAFKIALLYYEEHFYLITDLSRWLLMK